jgi:hypothetical protein
MSIFNRFDLFAAPARLRLSLLAGAFAAFAGGMAFGDRYHADGTVLAPGGNFHRFEAAYIVRGTGEVLSFDVVVACQKTLKTYLSDGASVSSTDPARAPHPWLVAAPTKSGAALLVNVPKVCGPQEGAHAAGGRIVPSATWFAKAEDLAKSSGAAAKIDYASPSAEVEFLSASIMPASFSDYAAQVRRQAAAGPADWAGTPFGFSEAQIAAGIPPRPKHLEARAE